MLHTLFAAVITVTSVVPVDVPSFKWTPLEFTEVRDDDGWFEPGRPHCITPKHNGKYELVVDLALYQPVDTLIKVLDDGDSILTFRGDTGDAVDPIFPRMVWITFDVTLRNRSCLSVMIAHTGPEPQHVIGSFTVRRGK